MRDLATAMLAAMTIMIMVYMSASSGNAQVVDREQKSAAVNSPQVGIVYPHINMARTYKVDPNWPLRSESMQWGHVPGVAVDKQDRVWVGSRVRPPLRVYDAAGRFLFAWNNKDIDIPHYLKIDRQGNIWLTDTELHVVRKFAENGQLLLTLGTPGEPGDDQTHLNQPTDVAVTPDGEAFVTDGYGNNRIVHFDSKGRFVKQWGKLGVEPGEFSLPHAVVLDSAGRLYVADRNNVRIQVFDQSGKFLDQWCDLVVPWGLWMSDADEIWVCGSSPTGWEPDQKALGYPPKDQVVMKFDTSGRLRQLWTLPKAEEEQQQQPGYCNAIHGLALDSKGNIYVGEIDGKRIQKFVPQVRHGDTLQD